MSRSLRPRTYATHVAVAVAALALVSCGGTASTARDSSFLPVDQTKPKVSPIQHVVVIIQENRSFDNLFAKFPGADGATEGEYLEPSGKDVEVPLKEVGLGTACDPTHGYEGFLRNLDGGKMDNFGLTGNACGGDHTAPYEYVNPEDIGSYWYLAQNYVLGDHMFQTQGSGSFTAHQDLIAGATIINPPKTISLVDVPTATPWGCDNKYAITERLIYLPSKNQIQYSHFGPHPCLDYKTLRDRLDAKSVSWKYYSPPYNGKTGGQLWNAFDAIKAVRYSSQWGTNVTFTNTQIFTDISNSQLPAVSWVIPTRVESDHPDSGAYDGPAWVASVVNAIGESQYWKSTAIFIVWDDWGGWYDNVPPPLTDHWGGLGFRVPLIVVSAYAREAVKGKPGLVVHQPYEFGSILKFIEHTFGLKSLNTTDARANGMGDCFNFSAPARTFTQIPSSHTKEYFMHLPPSNQPVDEE